MKRRVLNITKDVIMYSVILILAIVMVVTVYINMGFTSAMIVLVALSLLSLD